MTQTQHSLKKPTWSPTPAHSDACHELEVNATLGTMYGGEEFPLTAFLVRLSSMMAVVSTYAGSATTASAFSVQVSAQVVLTSANICLIWSWIAIFC